MGGLEDDNEDVRLKALWTLQRIFLGTEDGSERHKKILAGLKASADSRTIPPDTRDAINNILEGQTGAAP
jgi:hypothetical protein